LTAASISSTARSTRVPERAVQDYLRDAYTDIA
jgi:hypothetical protein